MRRQYVKIRENNRAFKSCLDCDKYLGSEGLSKATLKNPNHFHERYNMHIDTISKEEYDSLTKNSDDTYRDIVHTYKIKCAYCGMLFHPTNVHQKFCDRHHSATCVVCGKEFDCTEYLKKHKRAPRTCSKNCAVLERKQTIKEKQKDPNYEKQKLEKRRQTCIDKYGVDNVSKDPNIQKKIKDVIEDKYGVDNVGKIDKAVKNREEYWNDRNRIKLANLKREEANLKLFGSKYYTQSTMSHLNQGFDEMHAKRLQEFYEDPEVFIKRNFQNIPVSTYELAKFLGTDWPANEKRNFLQERNLVAYRISTMEGEVCEILRKLVTNIKIINNDRSQIAPLELDIYLPEYRLAIECDPTYTHNSSFKSFDSEPLSDNYHKLKTDMCDAVGIRLIHIFGYIWTYKKDQMIDVIKSALGLNRKIYARCCSISEVSSKESRSFLNFNHIQGYVNSRINLGLYYDKELVSLMSFNKIRSTIGQEKTDNDSTWELSRFCNKSGISVIGGASKLLNYFENKYNPKSVKSYSNRSYTSGKLYEKLGFELKRISNPDYVWVDTSNDKAYNRVNAQKRNIKKFLNDESVDVIKTEKQIMEEHNYAQVYGSGTITWIKNFT